jgi:hypothetical protein
MQKDNKEHDGLVTWSLFPQPPLLYAHLVVLCCYQYGSQTVFYRYVCNTGMVYIVWRKYYFLARLLI